MKGKYLWLIAAAIALAACNGGGGSSNVPGGTSLTSSSAAVSLFVTDNLSDDYAKVWVTVNSVSALDANGQAHILYSNTDGAVFNLSELYRVGALLDTRQLPVGAYQTLRLTLTNQLSMVNANGQTVTAHFNADGTPKVIDVPAAFTVRANQNTAIGLDFDLKQFQYNPATGIVTPIIVFRNDDSVRALEWRYAEVEGRVTAIADAGHFTLNTEHNNISLSVTLAPGAVIIDKSTATTAGDTSLLSVNDRVDVYGNYDSVSLSVAAARVKIEKETDNAASQASRYQAEGRVITFDGSTLLLDVREANFVPGGNTLSVANVSNAVFSKGSPALLAAGQRVEVKGAWDGSTFSANTVEIEGAARASSGSSNQVEYAEVKGMIVARDQDRLTLQVLKAEHVAIPAGGTMNVDIATAWLKNGRDACLNSGALVEVKGAFNNGLFTGRVIEVEDGCGAASSSSSDSSSANGNDDSTDRSGSGSAAHVEIKGLVQTIEGDSVTLQVLRYEGFNPGSQIVTADISHAWFKDGERTPLSLNALVEIQGSWNHGVLSANKVEYQW